MNPLFWFGKVKVKSKKKPLSTPSSPSRIREPQCTCMTQETLRRVRAEHRGRTTAGAATLPRAQARAGDDPSNKLYYESGRERGLSAAPSGTSVYDNVSGGGGGRRGAGSGLADTGLSSVRAARSEASLRQAPQEGGGGADRAERLRSSWRREAKSVDYSEMESIRESPLTRSGTEPRGGSSDAGHGQGLGHAHRRSKSKSTDDMFERLSHAGDLGSLSLDSNTLKRMLQPMAAVDGYSPQDSPERLGMHLGGMGGSGRLLGPMSRSAREINQHPRGLYLDIPDHDQSPPSDHIIFDNHMYATTPSSSNGNGEGGPVPTPNSPTGRLLMEYELHLRNTLARGLDAESCSLHTFEALLTQSMENLVADVVSSRDFGTGPLSKSSTLPHSKAGLHVSSASILSSHEQSIVQQTSVDSADSRLCYLTSSEISDDDRMSLTTAVSDEDDVESSHNSPYKSRSSSSATSAFNCTGAVRKAGFLSVKKWLLRKKHQVELARKRGWKGYWVCLKGTTLLFYPCDNRDGRAIDNTPKHLIVVDGAIMQPIPEHPKREYIFCLSTAFGDAYLFQAPCQVELENWVNSIHSACAAAFARHRGKTGTLHLLQEEICRLEKETESDNKMKHMADLQLTVVSDVESRQTILSQISQWEENLERLHCEQFRLRCYMASLQNSELPNPKNLLSHVSRNTKTTLNRLGVFTVSSFHAFVCARSPSLLNNLLAGRGATKRRAPAILSRSNSGSSRRSLSVGGGGQGDLPSVSEKMVKVHLPDNQTTSVYVRDNMTVEEFLLVACSKKQLLASDHFVRLKSSLETDEYYVPHRNDLVENHTYESAEICAKILYQVELSRNTLDQMWGFSVEAELVENADRQDELCVMVSRVEDRSLAMQQGIIKSDEIMVINGAIVSDLDMMYIESVLQEELLLCMMMRSCRTEPPDFVNIMKTTDEFIEQLVCPPPPSDSALSEEMISGLIVPAPSWTQEKSPELEAIPQSALQDIPNPSSEQIENLLKFRPFVHHSSPSLISLSTECLPLTAEQVTEYCRSPLLERRKSTGTPPPSISNLTPATSTLSVPSAPARQLTDAEKLRKVISELVDTERTYVEHLNNLLENYLEPLKQETFLSSAEISALFGNIQEIVTFQRVFLQSLEKGLRKEPDFERFNQPNQFKNVLITLGDSFLRYANHFKLYSSFCASHSKAQRVLHPSIAEFSGEGNQMLQEFLQARNPKQQHSSTLESYLIKPIQRILKYPLLLQQLRNLTDPNSEEHMRLAGALKEMEKVAEHINEMQRIHEEYGAIFDHLYRQHLKSSKQHVDLSPGELLYYGGVEWLNISDFLGKIKKGLELHAMCFVFKSAVVFLCKERIRQKKKLMGGSSKGNHAEVEIIRYQVLIPVTEVQVRASTMKDVDCHFMWELIHLKSQIQRRSEKMYHLSNSTSEFRNAFLKTIRQIIRESVRNMNIPITKPLTKDKYGHYRKTGDSVSRTLSSKKKSQRGPQRHSAGNIDNDLGLETYDSVDFRSRSKTVGDPINDMSGSVKDLSDSKSDLGKDLKDSQSDKSDKSDKDVSSKPTLGRTPNHLSLSTTSTISTGSTGSTAAKLIQAGNAPTHYQPPQSSKPVGSPVWKPRDAFSERSPMPGPGKSQENEGREQFLVYDEYGGSVYMTPPSAKKDHSKATAGSSKQSDC